MASTAPGPQSVAGPYRLVARNRSTGRFEHTAYASLAELANAVYVKAYEVPYPGYYDRDRYAGFDHLSAFTPRGATLAVEELRAYGRRLHHLRHSRHRRQKAYAFRSGPVPGIHRLGSYCYFRQVHTSAERRLGALVLAEDGEVGPRAARSPSNVPDSRDDHPRHIERCWKRQRKGKKAWAR